MAFSITCHIQRTLLHEFFIKFKKNNEFVIELQLHKQIMKFLLSNQLHLMLLLLIVAYWFAFFIRHSNDFSSYQFLIRLNTHTNTHTYRLLSVSNEEVNKFKEQITKKRPNFRKMYSFIYYYFPLYVHLITL